MTTNKTASTVGYAQSETRNKGTGVFIHNVIKADFGGLLFKCILLQLQITA